ncbi:MAG: sporulation protein [Pseudomonadota bacterium]|nr:sporulation protein [Pseudomonadota bacterium]
MGFFDSILGMFGIGQPKLAVQTSATQAGPGKVIDATLTITGGSRPLPLTALILSVKSTKEERRPDGTTGHTFEEYGKVVLPQGGRVIAPGQVITMKMRVQVPAGVPPTGDGLKYKIVASADVPGLDADASQPLTVTDTPDAWAGEDLTKYHVTESPLSYRHSSVKSDFRILRLNDGFVVTWKNELSARNFDGSQKWRVSGWGRSFTASPDGTRLLVSNQQKELAILDAATGEVVQGPTSLGKWPGDLAWLPGEALVIGTDEGVTTMQTNFFPIGVSFGGDTYVGGVAASTDKRYFVSYPNSNLLKWTEVPTGDHGRLELPSPGDILPSKDGSLLAVRAHDEFHLVDASTLKLVRTIPVPGLKGIRHLGQEQHSSTHFGAMPRIADDNTRVLCQDGSGQLWLLDKSGDATYVWPREVVDLVEDTCWIGGDDFVALTNDGRVLRLSTRGGAPAWVQQDG